MIDETSGTLVSIGSRSPFIVIVVWVNLGQHLGVNKTQNSRIHVNQLADLFL